MGRMKDFAGVGLTAEEVATMTASELAQAINEIFVDFFAGIVDRDEDDDEEEAGPQPPPQQAPNPDALAVMKAAHEIDVLSGNAWHLDGRLVEIIGDGPYGYVTVELLADTPGHGSQYNVSTDSFDWLPEYVEYAFMVEEGAPVHVVGRPDLVGVVLREALDSPRKDMWEVALERPYTVAVSTAYIHEDELVVL